MADSANLKSVRLQYIVIDTAPAMLRDVRLQYIAGGETPASIRRVTGSFLTIDKNPINVKAVRAQFLEPVKTPASVRRVTGQFLVVDKSPLNLRDIRLQYLEPSRSPASVRRLVASVLTRDRDPANVKAIRVQFAEMVNNPPKLNIDVWTKLLSIINSLNGWNFTTSQLTPGTPKIAPPGSPWNTELEVTALPASGFSGKVKVYYQRFPISDFFMNNFPLLDFNGKNTTRDMLPQINAAMGTFLTADDVEDTPINRETNTMTVVISNKSWLFLEGSTFSWQNVASLADMYPVTDLPGFFNDDAPLSVIDARPTSGIHQIRASDGSTFPAYVDMTTDGGYWIQVGHWTTVAPTVNDQLLVNEVLMAGYPIKGFSTDTVNRPIITDGKITSNPAKQWMLKHDHPTWKSLFGDWQIGDIIPKDAVIPYNQAFPVKTSIGNKSIYGQRSGWGMPTTGADAFGFWTQPNQYGPCGGAGIAGGDRCCPVSDFVGNFGVHADFAYQKRLYVRASNF
jgi:hypothetical protein